MHYGFIRDTTGAIDKIMQDKGSHHAFSFAVFCVLSTNPLTAFVEQFPDWLPRYARRTDRQTGLVRDVGFEISEDSRRNVLRKGFKTFLQF